MAVLDGSGTTFEITEPLQIETVEDVRAVLLPKLGAAPEVMLDLSAVSGCDAAGLQLLCSARKFVESQGKRLRITGACAAVRECAALLGMHLEIEPQVPQNISEGR